VCGPSWGLVFLSGLLLFIGQLAASRSDTPICRPLRRAVAPKGSVTPVVAFWVDGESWGILSGCRSAGIGGVLPRRIHQRVRRGAGYRSWTQGTYAIHTLPLPVRARGLEEALWVSSGDWMLAHDRSYSGTRIIDSLICDGKTAAQLLADALWNFGEARGGKPFGGLSPKGHALRPGLGVAIASTSFG